MTPSDGQRAPEPSPRGDRQYLWFAPRPEHAPWVSHLWVQEAPAEEAPPTTVVPSGMVELVVCYGDPFVHVEGGRHRPVPAVTALGQRTRPIQVAATGVTRLVLAGLHPWAGECLLGPEPGAFTDGMVDLADVIGRPRVATLLDRVATAATAELRALAVEGFLAGLCRQPPDALAVACAGRVSHAGGDVSVGALARELGVSERHLRRRFAEAAGVGPKRLARVVRAQRALTGLRAGLPGAAVAQRWGYVDVAHLTRELKAIMGRTPGDVSRSREETALMRSFNRAGGSSFFETIYL